MKQDIAEIAGPMRLKLDRRIHNQRVALRDNWMIVERRRVGTARHYLHARYSAVLLRLHNENYELKRENARLSHLLAHSHPEKQA